jgi:osmotically-inducible protein OsmY
MDSHPTPTPTEDVASQADLDLDLAERVTQAVNGLDVVRGTRAHVTVMVAGGHVTLAGVLQSPMAAAEVEHVAAYVSGGAPITNKLVDDAALSTRVAEALATDARTASIPPGYEVASVYGHLSLVGAFTAAEAEAARAVAQGVPGVLTVAVKIL